MRRRIAHKQRVSYFFVGALFLLVCASPSWSAPVAPSKLSAAQSPQNAREAVLAHIAKESGVPVLLPEHPSQGLRGWLSERQSRTLTTKEAQYQFLGEQLLVAQALFQQKTTSERGQGLLVAGESASFAAAHLRSDRWLLARIYQGFILPYISLAHIQRWRDPSRQRLIEAAVGAFERAEEFDVQQRVLEWLLEIGERPPSKSTDLQIDLNTLDWTRGTLASLLAKSSEASRADLERALALLRAIQSPDMKGFKRLQDRIEKRLAANATSPSSP